MVKRPKSPDLVDDAKYLICYHPWPHNTNWEIEKDYIRFCRWLAVIVGPDALFAFHYKPAARGTVLIEIDKTCPKLELLLGEHRWIEFLKAPSEEERKLADNNSKIFYSIYPTGREAQKDGWKRVHIKSAWFEKWSPVNMVIQNPYPTTHWCDVPAEDPTNKSLCHRLPVSVKPPPPKAPAPVVGSAAWATGKLAPAPSNKVVQGVWKDGIQSIASGSGSGSGSNGSASKGKAPAAGNKAKSKSSTKPTSSPILVTKPQLPTSAWSKPPSISATPLAPSASSALSASIAPKPTYPAPPGLTHPAYSAPPGLTGSRTAPNAPGSSNIQQLTDQFVGVSVSLSPSQEADLYKDPYANDEEGEEGEMNPGELEVAILAPWERGALPSSSSQLPGEGGGDLWSGSSYQVTEGEDREGEENTNLWGDEYEKKDETKVILCPAHNIVCKKGICLEMAKLLKKMEREERDKARGAPSAKDGKGKGPAGWRKGATPANKAEAKEDGFVTTPSKGRAKGRAGGGGGGAWGKMRSLPQS